MGWKQKVSENGNTRVKYKYLKKVEVVLEKVMNAGLKKCRHYLSIIIIYAHSCTLSAFYTSRCEMSASSLLCIFIKTSVALNQVPSSCHTIYNYQAEQRCTVFHLARKQALKASPRTNAAQNSTAQVLLW